MDFPVYIPLGPWTLHPHLVFESLAYGIAFRLSLRNFRRDSIAPNQRSSVLVGGLVGALIGAKGLVALQHIDLLWQNWLLWGVVLLQGKTVVGALLGAVMGVELTKHWIGLKQSTGDAFVYPLLIGTAIGRVGCFLTGLSDRTYGVATTLPWGVDFGDGVLRHPTQLYEIVFLILLMGFLMMRSRYQIQSGELFKFYIIGYLSFRLFCDSLKPDFHPIWSLSAVQIACIFGLVYYTKAIPQIFKFQPFSKVLKSSNP